MELSRNFFRRLILVAVVTIPLVVGVGIFPAYFLAQGATNLILTVMGLITVNITMIWTINILLVRYWRKGKMIFLYLTSFGVIFPINLFLRSLVPIPQFIQDLPVDTTLVPALNSLIINVIVWVIIELLRSQEAKRMAQATIDKLRIENLEAQKQSLIRQMQPHFLFNAMSTLKALIGESQEDAETYVVKLSNFLRYSFANQTDDLTTIEQELDFTLNYIELQSIRFGDAFTYTIDIPTAVRAHRLPVFALQTLIENIFKHNYFSQKKPLRFNITYKGEQLVVWNEKAGLKLTERNETGLANLNKRYELTNGSHIHVEDTETTFLVKIPVLKP